MCSSRKSIEHTVLKITIVVVIYIIFSVVEFVVFRAFFDKGRFTIKFFIDITSRNTLLANTFNSYRAEIIEGELIQDTNFSILYL